MLTCFHFITPRSSNDEKISQRERVAESNLSRRHGRVAATSEGKQKGTLLESSVHYQLSF
jgi:hypothetical protein